MIYNVKTCSLHLFKSIRYVPCYGQLIGRQVQQRHAAIHCQRIQQQISTAVCDLQSILVSLHLPIKTYYNVARRFPFAAVRGAAACTRIYSNGVTIHSSNGRIADLPFAE